MSKNTYDICVDCCWIESVKANSLEEAIEQTKSRYKDGKGRFPREFVDVYEYKPYFCQIED